MIKKFFEKIKTFVAKGPRRPRERHAETRFPMVFEPPPPPRALFITAAAIGPKTNNRSRFRASGRAKSEHRAKDSRRRRKTRDPRKRHCRGSRRDNATSPRKSRRTPSRFSFSRKFRGEFVRIPRAPRFVSPLLAGYNGPSGSGRKNFH